MEPTSKVAASGGIEGLWRSDLQRTPELLRNCAQKPVCVCHAKKLNVFCITTSMQSTSSHFNHLKAETQSLPKLPVASGQKESSHLSNLDASKAECWECKRLDSPEVYFNVILCKHTKAISCRFLDVLQVSVPDSWKKLIPFFPCEQNFQAEWTVSGKAEWTWKSFRINFPGHWIIHTNQI